MHVTLGLIVLFLFLAFYAGAYETRTWFARAFSFFWRGFWGGNAQASTDPPWVATAFNIGFYLSWGAVGALAIQGYRLRSRFKAIFFERAARSPERWTVQEARLELKKIMRAIEQHQSYESLEYPSFGSEEIHQFKDFLEAKIKQLESARAEDESEQRRRKQREFQRQYEADIREDNPEGIPEEQLPPLIRERIQHKRNYWEDKIRKLYD